jgi:putative chitinase
MTTAPASGNLETPPGAGTGNGPREKHMTATRRVGGLCLLLGILLVAAPAARAEPPPDAGEAGPLALAQLRAIMPHLPKEKAEAYLEPLKKALAEYDITTPKRRAGFLAQLAHESGELRYMEEIASGEAYEGRKDLGNTEPGDGKRYKGRGPIQLTGRANYRSAGKALGLDLEGNPAQAAQPEVGFRVAGWFWKTHGLNELTDKGDFRQITRRINGGYRGEESREKYYRRALVVLDANP